MKILYLIRTGKLNYKGDIMKKNIDKNNVIIIIVFLFFLILGYLFPYTNDDWAWGTIIFLLIIMVDI